MEILILCLCLAAALSCLTITAMAGLLFWKHCFSPAAKKEEAVRQELSKEELAAARAQREYEQAFVDMMHYDGSPRKKEERVQF